jgi:hypothetical protein
MVGEEEPEPSARAGLRLLHLQRAVEVADVGEYSNFESAGLLGGALRSEGDGRENEHGKAAHHFFSGVADKAIAQGGTRTAQYWRGTPKEGNGSCGAGATRGGLPNEPDSVFLLFRAYPPEGNGS